MRFKRGTALILIPKEIINFMVSTFLPPVAMRVMVALVKNAYDLGEDEKGLTRLALCRSTRVDHEETIIYALGHLTLLGVTVEGSKDSNGRRYYRLQKDLSLWRLKGKSHG